MKVVATVPTWRRPVLLPMVLECWRRMKIQCVVVGSEGDASRKPAEDAGALYVEHENEPLGAKFNAAWRAAKQLNPDYVIQWADDALVTSRFHELYPFGRHDFIGFVDSWFRVDWRTVYFKGYGARREDPCGTGRALSKKLLETVGWEPYDSEANRSLDHSLWNRIGHKAHKIYLKDTPHRIVNIKTAFSITNIDKADPKEVEEVQDPIVDGLISEYEQWYERRST